MGLQAKADIRGQIRNWKHQLVGLNDYDRYVHLLEFPSGAVSLQVWEEEVLSSLSDKNPVVRQSVAYVVGNIKLYPSVSIPALIRLFGDTSDGVATTAMFSLMAFGPAVIDDLCRLMENKPPPYVYSDDIHSSWIITLKAYNKLEGYEKKEVCSLPATRAILCARVMGDTVLHYLAKHPGVSAYFKAHILSGIRLTKENFRDYYKQAIKIKYLFKDYDSAYFVENFIYDKLFKDLSADDATELLRRTDTALLRGFLLFIPTIGDDIGFDYSLIPVDEKNDTSVYRESDLYSLLDKLNYASLHKSSFKKYRAAVVAWLKKDIPGSYSSDPREMLTLMLSNIGDSARDLLSLLKPYERARDLSLRYMAIKAEVNMLLNSNGNFVVLSRDILNPRSSYSYFLFSDELKEGFRLSDYHRVGIKEGRENGLWAFCGKIYLDENFDRINANGRSLSVRDSQAVSGISRFLSDSDNRVRVYAAYALGLSDSATDAIRMKLIPLLKDTVYEVRKAACDALINLGIQGKGPGQYVTVFTLMDYFNTRVYDDQEYLHYVEDLYPFIYEKGGSPQVGLPSFPNPPPKPSTDCLITPSSGALTGGTLGDVYERLHDDLENNGYVEQATFQFLDGFALITRMERLKKDGSIDFVNRYTRTKLTPRGIGDYFYLLFCGDEGLFRGTALIVCGKPSLAPFGHSLVNGEAYDKLFSSGGSTISNDISKEPSAGKNIYLLIYEYGKSADGSIYFMTQDKAMDVKTGFDSMHLSHFKIQ